MKIEIEVEIPEGYEATGEYRPARKGEPLIDETGGFCDAASFDYKSSHHIILRKKKSKVIVFVPVDSFEKATIAEEDRCRYGIFKGDFGSWYNEPGDKIQWLSREEREEAV